MKKKYNFLRQYLFQAPVFMVMERAIECRLISGLELKRPILDLGCGDGIFSSILFSESVDLGIDISFSELVASLNKNIYKNVISGNLSMLPLRSESFNTIICNSVMEHVTDLKGALGEARRILSPGGKFILTLPTENYDKFLFYPHMLEGFGLKKLAGYYRDTVNKIFKHYHAYTPQRWIKIIEAEGFRIIKTINYCPREVMTLSGFYLPLSFISLLNKKIFRRWILCPALRKFTANFLEMFLKKAYLYDGSDEGGCILIEATRV